MSEYTPFSIDHHNAQVAVELKTRVLRLEELIKAVHQAKGRYHTQLAMCSLYDAVGLPNERPKK